MNRLTSQQRKLIYLGAIVVLAVPVIWLGMPPGKAADTTSVAGEPAESVGGGKLAQLRREYDLGESSLGNVDPTSATMNLVLMGFRGWAVSKLHADAIQHQERKDWPNLKANVESIILLQPHYVKIWEFQAWNLAYNVSTEWDLIEDKYFWIKEGAKFNIRGSRRNSKDAYLYFHTGRIMGEKVGTHDAWRYMRKFFNPSGYERAELASSGRRPVDKEGDELGDPEVWKEEGIVGPDPDLNPRDVDNYLVAKKWFLDANDADLKQPQRRMSSVAFRQKPARSQLAYPEMMQKEGRFQRPSDQRELRRAWDEGLSNWTDRFEEDGRPGLGKEEFVSLGGLVTLDADDEKLKELMKRDNPPGRFSLEEKKRFQNTLRNIVNYRYWETRGRVEKMPDLVNAHADIHAGKQFLKRNQLALAMSRLERGLQLYAGVLNEYPQLTSEDNTLEEVMIGILAWRDAKNLLHESIEPNDIPRTDPPLNALWNAQQPKLDQYMESFKRELQ